MQGISPLFAGLSPALAGSVLQFGLLVGLFEPLRDRTRAAAPNLPRRAACRLSCHSCALTRCRARALPDMTAGALAGVAACVATNPIYLVKARLQTLPASSMGGAGALSLARHVVRDEGAAALLRGVAPSLLLVSFNAIQLPLLHELRTTYGLPTLPAVAGSVAAASVVTYPLQLVRTRFQAQRAPAGAQRTYASFRDVVRHTMTCVRARMLASSNVLTPSAAPTCPPGARRACAASMPASRRTWRAAL